MRKPLTDKERAVLEFIAGFQANEGRSPSLTAIAEMHLGDRKKKHHVKYYITALTHKGWIKTKFINRREIEILDNNF